MKQPHGPQLRYQSLLTSMQRTMEELLREVLYPALPELLSQAEADRAGVRQDSATDDLLRIFSDMALLFAQAYPPTAVTEEITGIAQDNNDLNRVEFRDQMQDSLGLFVVEPEGFQQAALDAFIADNQALVATLHGDELEAFKTITSRGMRAGLRVEDIQKELMHRLGITKSRAALLARDQTLKLYGELTEMRQRNVGITEYDWDTSQNERVRARHAELHGTRQKWTDPPIVDYRTGRRAHPGGDYQCHCQPIPVIPEALLVE
jgi:SPP1 gp7 family putative phage head morphogenesis protein